jgi:signal transduction histidine kinase
MTRALIVDDRPENRYLLRTLLKGRGYDVAEAEHGVAALAKARQQAPDIVVSDLLMPVMDGYTLLREWRGDAALARIPFIVYTSTYTESDDEKLARDLGADAFIVKPAEPEDFLRRLGDVLARAREGTLPAHAPAQDGETTLKLYNAVLVRKLEKRTLQLEQRVAELAASQAQIQRLNRLYMALSETNHAIVQTAEREALFDKVCRIAVARGGFVLAWIGLLDARSGEITPVASCGPCEDWFARLRPYTIRGARRVPVEYAVGDGRMYFCNDLAAAPEYAAIRDALEQAGLRAAASLPLSLGGHVVGALSLFAGERNFFDDKLTDLVCEMAQDVSFALENFEKESLRRETEEELRLANVELEARVAARTAELAAANKELEAFAYSASHDLRAPLRGIDGFSRILQEDYGDRLDETGRSHLERVRRAAQHMGELIDDLLNLSMAGRQEMQPGTVDLSGMAQELIGELTQGVAQRELEIRVAPGCTATGDARLLRVALRNLLDNALKYTSRQPRARIEFGRVQSDGLPAFLVRDNGAGFDMQFAGRLFEPFQRLHPREQFDGTGVGLATVARVVARHGGRIWAEAAPGAGATFYFTLS